jgi:predicted metal-dependent peptidase
MHVAHRLRAKLLLESAFFGSVLMSTELVETDQIDTAATDGARIYYNLAFLESLDDSTGVFVVCHEIFHIILKHALRQGSRDKELWNIACDHAINLQLKACGFSVWKEALCDAQYAGLCAEQIYEGLLAEEQAGGDPRGGDSGQLARDLMGSGNLSAEERTEIARTVDQRVARAAACAKASGQGSPFLDRLLGEVLGAVTPWREYLRDYMTRVTQDDESWGRRNRRFADVFLPARHTLRVGDIVMIGDTSGSISHKALREVAGEVSAVADAVQPEVIRMVWADTKVAGEESFECGQPIDVHPCGGGGTDMRAPLAYVEKYDPSVVVLLTDGETPWPTVEPPYPLIVVCTTKADCPVGLVVRK